MTKQEIIELLEAGETQEVLEYIEYLEDQITNYKELTNEYKY